jgi:hypothetical protein
LVAGEGDIAAARQFRTEHLPEDVGDVRIAPTGLGFGEAIQQAFEVGHARPLRLVIASAIAAPLFNALPVAFPINKTKRLVAAHAVLFALDGEVGVQMLHLQINQPQALESICKLLRIRAEHSAFASQSRSEALDAPIEIFTMQRCTSEQRNKIISMVNVSPQAQLISLDWRALLGTRHAIRDLVTGVRFNVHGPSLELQPYQVMWATL